MSKYRKIKTEFKDRTCLLRALRDSGVPFETHVQPEHLVGYLGDTREETAEFIVRRAHLENTANDLGFARQADGSYIAIISEYDSGHGRAALKVLNTVKQRYALHAVTKLAKAKGYTVVQKAAPGGAIRLQLRQY